jgi:uncharacterized protein
VTQAGGIPSAQAEVAAFLAGLAGATPIETHISAIFVGRETAWKIKKAVALGFLDFSSLEARGHFCRRELEVNQPAAPGIYRDVVAVTRAPDGNLQQGGGGEVVEWVLRMAPIPTGDFLDRVAACGGLDDKLLDTIQPRHRWRGWMRPPPWLRCWLVTCAPPAPQACQRPQSPRWKRRCRRVWRA